ncbi:hypothetical protein AVEN_208644-1 [Araneus ventricosus]|uniref:Uncharacterized protein n=1 Tax=Araneus ventricosus TaxID=182803 RepID=A0A4Y2DVC7_ARAVE|nr:hypothetical protein AVEN_208644-1 [Araneus ventricosus]
MTVEVTDCSDMSPEKENETQTEFSVFSDADHAGDEKTRSSTSGMVSINSYATITWWSRLQHSVAISSTEAEYVATREALMSFLGSVALQRVD